MSLNSVNFDFQECNF